MRLLNTPKRLMLPLAPLAALLLTACGDARPALALPPLDRTEQIAPPAVPDGEASCLDGSGVAQPCLSDQQIATLIADLAHALDLANGKLAWLHDWIATAQKGAR